MDANRRIVLKARPVGIPKPDDFELVAAPVPEIRDGEFLIRSLYLGLAPASRLRMSEGPSYAAPTPLGAVIYGQALGIVEASRHSDFQPGDRVVSSDAGWQAFSISNGERITKLAATSLPDTYWLGALGVSGLTAYVGLIDIGLPRSGETVLVSAATGAVGSAVGQIARILGCRVVGVAGGEDKCAYAVEELGLDACVNHHSVDLEAALTAVAPNGVDVYFDNVGGKVRDAAIRLMNDFGRIVVCGMISEYNGVSGAHPDWRPILTRRLSVRGFLMRDHLARKADFERDMTGWLTSGAIKVKEHLTNGLENAPKAFIDMLQGRNFGKTIVRL